MGYLSNLNNEIIIDAILTRYGREKLAAGNELGISKFALSDDEVDYILYDTTNPYGSDYYDIAIRKLPVLEPVPNSSTSLRYRLFTSATSVDTPYTVQLSFPEVFNTGIWQTDTTFSVTPSISPLPSNPNAIWYKFELTPWNMQVASRYIRMEGIIDRSKASNDLLLAYNELQAKIAAGQYPNYVVGHYMTLSTLSVLPPTAVTATLTTTGYGPGLSTRPSSQRIVLDRTKKTTNTVS